MATAAAPEKRAALPETSGTPAKSEGAAEPRTAPQRSQAEVAKSLAAKGISDRSAPPNCEACARAVLLQTPNYIVINKPPDVRMDGDFDVTVEKLIKHWCPDLKDVAPRWVHQLDYATSGVLCVALSAAAANEAHKVFASGDAKKTYLAVVQGHVKPLDLSVRDGLSGHLKQDRKKRKGVQYQPASAMFFVSKKRIKQRHDAGDTLSEQDAQLLHKSWQEVKKDKSLADEFRAASEADKARMTAQQIESEWQAAQGGPDRGVFRLAGDPEDVFYVDAGIQNMPGDFKMMIGTCAESPGRHSRTKVVVLGHGSGPEGQPISLVELHPISGRRHQLRLHLRHAGHPILGDATYDPEAPPAARMYLHSCTLHLPLAEPLSARTDPPFKLEDGQLVTL